MKCPKCQFDNTKSAKICAECGRNLALPSEPPPKDLSFDEKIDKIQRYLPKGLTDKILSQRDKIEGERKQVPYIREKHREASPDVLKWESIGSLSNCSACHTTAEKGLYEDGYVVIPR